IYHCLRGRCARRSRGYNENSHHGGCYSSSEGFSSLQGHGSFFCGREGSVTCSRGTSSWQPMPTSSTCSIAAGYSCGGDGSVVIASDDSGGTSGWGVAEGTVPVYSTGRRIGYSREDSGRNIIGSSGGGGGSTGRLGITVGGGSGYGYDASPRERALTTGGDGDGSGYYSGGSGYGTGGYSGPELSSGGGGSSQATQQKCPVDVPKIKTQQSKQTSHWPPSQKK
ncbi:PREDICTED: loricrin-like, partial [Tauraco erythrolophus]|uniref:loricrin-like n=1 Tax=Tauraco erythrolophus TaxID=121530 RepID=UPI0005234132